MKHWWTIVHEQHSHLCVHYVICVLCDYYAIIFNFITFTYNVDVVETSDAIGTNTHTHTHTRVHIHKWKPYKRMNFAGGIHSHVWDFAEKCIHFWLMAMVRAIVYIYIYMVMISVDWSVLVILWIIPHSMFSFLQYHKVFSIKQLKNDYIECMCAYVCIELTEHCVSIWE